MAVTLAKSQDQIQQAPLVELAFEILKTTKEPTYFRDLMKEIQELRGMSDDEVMQIIARLYTELNIDGRFVCIGQNIWGLKRWYPADKTAEKAISTKRGFVRKSGDAFGDEDEDVDDYDVELDEDEDLDTVDDLIDDDASDDDVSEDEIESEEGDYSDDDELSDDESSDEEPFEEDEDDAEEEEY